MTDPTTQPGGEASAKARAEEVESLKGQIDLLIDEANQRATQGFDPDWQGRNAHAWYQHKVTLIQGDCYVAGITVDDAIRQYEKNHDCKISPDLKTDLHGLMPPSTDLPAEMAPYVRPKHTAAPDLSIA